MLFLSLLLDDQYENDNILFKTSSKDLFQTFWISYLIDKKSIYKLLVKLFIIFLKFY